MTTVWTSAAVGLATLGLAAAVAFAVEDTGIGIRAQDLPRLFQEFERIEPITGPKQEGTGLGLSVCYGVVREHGGIIGGRNREAGGARGVLLRRDRSRHPGAGRLRGRDNPEPT